MGGGYPLAGESGALQLTTPLDGSSTLQLTGPVIARNVKKWEVGEYNDLRSRSVGDDLVIHHVPQGAPAAQVIPGYDYSTGSAIAVPRTIHEQKLNPRNIIGPYSGTAAQLVKKGIQDVKDAGAPRGSIKRLTKLIQRKYREYLAE
jgi:hypothetical protein